MNQITEFKQDETQQELFVEFASKQAKKTDRFPSLNRPPKPILINASIDQVILVSIILILSACFIFFLGVLRGKSLVSKAPIAAVTQRAKAPAPAPIQKSVVPQKTVVMKSIPVSSSKVQPSTLVPKSAPVSKPTAPASMVADLSKPYTIQLVTFKKKDLAEQEISMLRKRGVYSFIIPSAGYFQVCAGQFASKAEALKDLKTLALRYKDCFLRRR